MESLNNILKKSLNKEFLSAIISNPREKGGIVKIKIRPVEHKDNILYQCEEHRNNQVFHHNLNEEEAAGYIENAMQEFKQMQMETRKFRYQVLVSKKGKMTIQRRLQTGRFKEIDLSHNRKKHYILEEGKAVPFLQDLGVMTKEGEIVRTKLISSARSTVSWSYRGCSSGTPEGQGSNDSGFWMWQILSDICNLLLFA